MSKVVVEYHPDAVQEYEHAVNYYAKISPQLAARFIDEIEGRVALLTETPDRWKILRGEVRAIQSRVFPFQILYRVKSDRISIVAVMHEKRDPEYWHSRIG